MKRFCFPCLVCALAMLAGCVPRPYERTAAALGLPEAGCRVEGHLVTIAGGGHTLAFEIGKRPAVVDGVRYHLNRPAGAEGIDSADAALLRHALAATGTDAVSSVPRPRLILLDAGHGGADRGCSVGDAWESQITLAIARETRRLLEAAGVRVLMTRETAKDERTLDDRVALAAGAPIDAFVSIHVNSAANPAAKGVEIFTLPLPGCDGTAADAKAWPTPLAGQAHLPQATRLALAVQRALLTLPAEPAPADRGVRHAHFKVLRDTPAPAILIETGFLTNAEDAARLTSPEGRAVLAAAIAKGLLAAFDAAP